VPRCASILMHAFLTALVVAGSAAIAAESIEQRVQSLESVIGGYPPHIDGENQKRAILQRYDEAKSELDADLLEHPGDIRLLLLRGQLQSMGHNMDIPGAWDGAAADYKAILKSKPDDVEAILSLAELWVNSNPALAPNAENLFRGAQCYLGKTPNERAQRGIFFALYYQGKIQAAARQASYLVRQWPDVEEYKRLASIANAVIARSGKNAKNGDERRPTIAMADCNQ